jgi:hypothetical protein
MFLEDLYFVRFCDEIMWKVKKYPRKHQQGGDLENRAIHMKKIHIKS